MKPFTPREMGLIAALVFMASAAIFGAWRCHEIRGEVRFLESLWTNTSIVINQK